ncbi:MAG: DUF4199 domain-containing protein [Chitinophagaceae bacterium]|nr:DUF4199 domain-containing protein [Chitinophagaceae bacterium]
MKKQLTPALKGLITGILMILVALASFYGNLDADSPVQYVIYALYAGGIAWTILAWARSPEGTGKYGDAFNQGFRCFIIVILLMVTFTAVFNWLHPEFAEEMARLMKEDLLKKKEKTPAEINEEVERFKNGYTTMLIYSSIFGYLIIGAAVTAVTAAFTLRRRA